MRSCWTLLFVPALCVGSGSWAAEKSAAPPIVKPAEKQAEKSAEEKAEDAFYANRMVISALEAEVKGDFAARDRLLKDAAQIGVAPAAQAHLGLINVGAKKPEWKSIDESMVEAAKDEKLLRYEKTRQQSADTLAGNLAMARWCLANKMPDQARAHLTRVLDFAPDHAAAREALGFVRIGDKWVSPQEIEQLQQNAAAKTNSIEKHGKTVAALIEKMKSKNPKEHEAALAAFMAFKEVSAVGAVEAALNTPDAPTSKLLIEWMGQVDCQASSLVLARYSLLHPEEPLRALAMEQLVKRPLHDFVPELLKMLSSPISMMVIPKYDRQGRLTGYRQAFGREGADDKDIQIVDRGFQRVLQPSANLTGRPRVVTAQDYDRNLAAQGEAEAQIRQQAEVEVQIRQLEMQRQNELIKQVNERISTVVAKVSGKPLTADAKDMWKWWDEYNETEYQSYKPERYKRSYSVSTYGIPTFSSPPPPPAPVDPSIRRCECFVAGTPVITQTGPLAIEKILVGDLVLNRNLQTGDLDWQPVLKTTVRPPAPIVAITIEEETLRCTAGHLYWVSGTGWKKASELKPGDILHGAKSPSRITAVDMHPEAETYNLEVADSPNYFVGKNMVLTHDVTPREANRQTFPGHDLVRQMSEQRPVKKTASR